MKSNLLKQALMDKYQDGGKVKKASKKDNSSSEPKLVKSKSEIPSGAVLEKDAEGKEYWVVRTKGNIPDSEKPKKPGTPGTPYAGNKKSIGSGSPKPGTPPKKGSYVPPVKEEIEQKYYMQPDIKKPVGPAMAFGYSGEVKESFGEDLGNVMVNGKPTRLQTYLAPASYDNKTGTWQSNTGNMNPTKITGYVGADGNFVAINRDLLGEGKYTFDNNKKITYDPTTLKPFGFNGAGEKLRHEGAKIASNSNQAQIIADVNSNLAKKGLGEVKVTENISPVNFGSSGYSINKQVPLESIKANIAPQKGVNAPAINNPASMEELKVKFKKGGLVKKFAEGTPTYGLRLNDGIDRDSARDLGLNARGESLGLESLTKELNALGGTKFEDMSGSEKSQIAKYVDMAGQATSLGINALDRKDGRSSYGGQAAAGAIKGGAKGFAIGTNPALLAATGGQSAWAAPLLLGTAAAAKGVISADKEKKGFLNATNEEVRANVDANQTFDPANPNAKVGATDFKASDVNTISRTVGASKDKINARLDRFKDKIGFADGGTIKGEGTGTSDSIKTKVGKDGLPEGSFITPAKNNGLAKLIRKDVLGENPDKVAKFKKGGEANVAVSNGEHLFTPAEKKKITAYLGQEILEKLAPDAEESEDKKCGGMVGHEKGGCVSCGKMKCECEDMKMAKGGHLSKSKAATMLHDGKINGKKITDQQRKYFAVVASGKAKYNNGGNVRNWDWA